MIVAIAGATGLTGSFCVQELLKNKQVSLLYAIGRRPTGIIDPKLKEIGLKDNKLTQEIRCDAFICCLGTTIKKAGSKEAFKAVDLDLPVYLAGELKKNGCEIVAVISAMGAASSSAIFYNRVKGQMEEAMQQLNFKSLSIMRPSLITGPRKEKRLAERIGIYFMKIIDALPFAFLDNYKSIAAAHIAKALLNTILLRKEGTTIYLSGDIKKMASKQI